MKDKINYNYMVLKSIYNYARKLRANLAIVGNDNDHTLYIYDLITCEVIFTSYCTRYMKEYVEDWFTIYSIGGGVIKLCIIDEHSNKNCIFLDRNNKLINAYWSKDYNHQEVKQVGEGKILILLSKHTRSKVDCIVAYDTNKQRVVNVLNTVIRTYINNGKITIYYFEDNKNKEVTLNLYK